jgi:Flp pilus assembly protein TadG
MEGVAMLLKNQKGAAVVEFAVIAPLLLVILFGIIEFSILMFDKAMLTNASREGARAGIVFVDDRADNVDDLENKINQVVRDYCEDHLISFGSGSSLNIDISWEDGDDANTTLYDSGDSLTVAVDYDFRFLVFSNLLALLGGNMGDVLNLQAVTVMRLE